MFSYVIGMIIRPHYQWRQLSRRLPGMGGAMFYLLVMAALPALAWYYGVTQVGWQIGYGKLVRMTPDSARMIMVLFYITQVLAVLGIGFMVHWMSRTYGAESTLATGVAVIGLAATPLFLAGLVGVYPVLWLDLLIGMAAVAYAIYLLYLGIPIVMNVSEERGFLFASAVIAAGMVGVLMIMGGTVMLWDMGASPQFTD